MMPLRYEAEGEAGPVPRSERPKRSPTKIADRFEDEVVRLRKELAGGGALLPRAIRSP